MIFSKFFRRANPVRTGNLIRMYDDTIRIEREAIKRGGKWSVYKLYVSDQAGRMKFILVDQRDTLAAAERLAKRI